MNSTSSCVLAVAGTIAAVIRVGVDGDDEHAASSASARQQRMLSVSQVPAIRHSTHFTESIVSAGGAESRVTSTRRCCRSGHAAASARIV